MYLQRWWSSQINRRNIVALKWFLNDQFEDLRLSANSIEGLFCTTTKITYLRLIKNKPIRKNLLLLIIIIEFFLIFTNRIKKVLNLMTDCVIIRYSITGIELILSMNQIKTYKKRE